MGRGLREEDRKLQCLRRKELVRILHLLDVKAFMEPYSAFLCFTDPIKENLPGHAYNAMEMSYNFCRFCLFITIMSFGFRLLGEVGVRLAC